MAALAHLGVGLAAKRAAPGLPLYVLILAAWAIDLVWAGFWLLGVEHLPTPGLASPWSHGLPMALLWSALAGLAAARVRDRRTGLFIGALVFSHWIVDFLSQPMTYAFPGSLGPPLLFDASRTVGLGLYGTALGQSVGEYGSLAVGAALYLSARLKLRRERKGPAGSAPAPGPQA